MATLEKWSVPHLALLTFSFCLGACTAKPPPPTQAAAPAPPVASTATSSAAQPSNAPPLSGRWTETAADAGFANEPRDEAWATPTESRFRQEFAAFLDARMEATCAAQGRCRIRIRAPGLVSEIAQALRLPGCKLDEAANEGKAAVYLLDCLPENKQWAEQTKAELSRRFDAWRAQLTLRLDSFECRSSRCRALFSFKNPADAERLRGEDLSGSLPILRDHGGAVSGFEPTPDGTALGMTMVIVRGDGGWTTQRSAYEYQMAREKRLAALRQEPRDVDWAAKTELALKTHYEEQLGKGAVTNVECRTSQCEVVFKGESRRYRMRTRDILGECPFTSASEDLDATLGKIQVHTLRCQRSASAR